MLNYFSSTDKQRIEEGIRKRYAKVALTPEGIFRYPTGRAGLEGLKYDPQMINELTPEVISSYCGVGNPFALEPIHKGESVLDVGCGGGVDTLIAAMMIGRDGKAIGIDLVPEMIARARENVLKTSLKNISFQESSAEKMPFPDESFDVVISNGAFNLVTDKSKALKEVFRVLKPRGRLMIADQILTGELPDDKKAKIEKWAR